METIKLLWVAFQPIIIFLAIFAVMRTGIDGAHTCDFIDERTTRKLIYLVDMIGIIAFFLLVFILLSRLE